LHHAALAFLYQGRIGPDAHSLGDILGAGNLRPWHPVDDRFVIWTKLRFAVRAEFWKSHFREAHPAIARRAQFLVITIAWHITAGLFARFDYARSLWKLMPYAINLDVQELRRWNWIGHYLFIIVLVLMLEIESPDYDYQRKHEELASFSKSFL